MGGDCFKMPRFFVRKSDIYGDFINISNRGVKDILILCADALSGIKDAINAAFPNTEYQRCIVHQIRNTLKYVSDKDRKEFARDLKRIYTAPNEKAGYDQMLEVSEKWEKKYPAAMKSWKSNWDVICPFLSIRRNYVKSCIRPILLRA